MRWHPVVSSTLVGVVGSVTLLSGCPGGAQAQTTISPPTVRPQTQALDRLESAITRPLPQPPPVPQAPGDVRWVPHQRVIVPGTGTVDVPGHWQHRLPSGDVIIPPMIGRADDGSAVIVPGGRLPGPILRQAP